ncbi:hypothetical protein NAEGRDRAFT_79578 [Naegleria gruberi]|uniref:Transmembrane protein n=1 Tax=Naegleria gruberi TaxID=5762 RepID=D2VDX4_NAEGR|nr:uncharacterized protein NAEGRDRAFT_79578 [Naegleria gruberi]EFC45073.1 hypothetical protein NAEGRDRAFT_79578 [Naegleria gruberi]|eukprot:XP_002677817.1 hypothetical protein NAEGRDRAFT_79578 [Naegleria gruberi strain NEG-M]
MMQSEQTFSNPPPMMAQQVPPQQQPPIMASLNGVPEVKEDKKRLIVDRASKRITALEDSVIQKYDVLQGHKHPKLFVRLSLIMAFLSIICFCIWILTTPTGYPWFIHILWVSSLVIGGLMIQGSPTYSDRLFSFHTLFFASTSFQLIAMNEHTPSSFPWSVYPVAVLLLAYCLHGMVVKVRQFFNHFYIHALFYSVINFIVFVTYCYTVHDFPWFLIVLGGWTVFLLAHFAIWKALTFRFNKQAEKANQAAQQNNQSGQQAVIQQPTQPIQQPIQPSFAAQTVPNTVYVTPSQDLGYNNNAPMVRESGFTGEIEDTFDENQFFDEEDEPQEFGKKKGNYEQV